MLTKETTVQKTKAAKAKKPPMEFWDHGTPNPACEAADIQSTINRTFHQEEAPAAVRAGDLRRNCRSSLIGTTAPTSTVQMLLAHRDIVIKAARVLGPGVIDLEANLTWKRAKTHDVPVA